MRTQHKTDFTAVIHKLNSWREEAISRLRDPSAHAEALALKHQLDSAIAALELCQRFQIRPDAPATVLPDLRTMTPSCAYRVMEDQETDDRTQWVELDIEGYHLELSPGDIIIEQGH